MSDFIKDNDILIKEWDYEKNKNLNVDTITSGSNKKVWWKCEKGHEWESYIYNRIKGIGCPYCSGRYPIKGETDLATTNPKLAKEWNYEKNHDLKPSDVKAGTNKKVWWKCKKGHEWEAKINDRSQGNGCPLCNIGKVTSIAEKTVFYYVNKYFDEVYPNYSPIGFKKKNIDIYISKLNVGIEYDGEHYYKDVNVDLYKDKLAQEIGISLYRIREGKCPKLNSSSICINMKNSTSKELEKAITELLIRLGIVKPDVKIERDQDQIFNIIEFYEIENSVQTKSKKLLKYWNYERNGNLNPSHISIGSRKKVWWKCEKGHEWKASIDHRIKGSGCPYCSNKKVLQGFNDLLTVSKELAKEWNYDKNNELKPTMITKSSNRTVWWKCKKGHEWEATVNDRCRGNGCPYCSGRYPIKGETDLATTNPELAKEWNYNKNENLKPTDIKAGANKKVWWKCEKGHEWEAIVNNRKKGKGCPYCSGVKVLKGFNDLVTTNPELAKEWNYNKNTELSPSEVTCNSNRIVWWKCEKGHEWEARIYVRNNGYKNCPFCRNKK